MGWNAIARHDGSSGWTVGARNQSAAFLGMTPLAEVPGSIPGTGAYRHYLHDHLGSTRALYDGSKALLARVAYTPYGEQAPSTAGAGAAYTFTGKPWEPETGLYHFPYRYYAPDRARWISRDPLGMVDGPNLYGYTRNNPMASFDPLGLSLSSFLNCWVDCFNDACTPISLPCAIACAAAAICLVFPNPTCPFAAAACAVCTRVGGWLVIGCALACLLKELLDD